MKRVPVIRRAITTPYNRRNADYNPEFLDKETLIRKFTPLIQSIHRYFCSYVGILDQPSDVADLYNQIQLEFLKLAQKYDPKRGVDFTGYIKFNLRHRIYYHVTKMQKRQASEQLTRQYGSGEELDLDTLAYDVPDEAASNEFFRREALASIPWEQLTPDQCELIHNICEDHMNLEEIAENHKVPIKSVQKQFDELCELLIHICTQGVIEDEYWEKHGEYHYSELAIHNRLDD